MKKMKVLNLVSAGKNWFEIKSTCEVIPKRHAAGGIFKAASKQQYSPDTDGGT